MRKPRNGSEESRLSRMQTGLCFTVFILILAVTIILVMVFAQSFPDASLNMVGIVAITALTGVVFAFVIKDSSTGVIKAIKFKVGKEGIDMNLEREERSLAEVTTILPKTTVPFKSQEFEKRWDEAKIDFTNARFDDAAEKYETFEADDLRYWDAQSNLMICYIRSGKYEQAEKRFENIQANCNISKNQGQGYVNYGDCLMGLSLLYPEKGYEEKALDSYRLAYRYDRDSIVSIFYFWFSEVARQNYQSAGVISYMIEKHKELSLLHPEKVEYFMKYKEIGKNEETEDMKMNWKKLVLTGILVIALNVVALAEATGVLNG